MFVSFLATDQNITNIHLSSLDARECWWGNLFDQLPATLDLVMAFSNWSRCSLVYVSPENRRDSCRPSRTSLPEVDEHTIQEVAALLFVVVVTIQQACGDHPAVQSNWSVQKVAAQASTRQGWHIKRVRSYMSRARDLQSAPT